MIDSLKLHQTKISIYWQMGRLKRCFKDSMKHNLYVKIKYRRSEEK